MSAIAAMAAAISAVVVTLIRGRREACREQNIDFPHELMSFIDRLQADLTRVQQELNVVRERAITLEADNVRLLEENTVLRQQLRDALAKEIA